MPNHLRRLLLALALALIVCSCAGAVALARAAGTAVEPRHEAQGASALVRPTAARHDPQPAARKRKPRPTLGERAAAMALTAVGVPYRWGGSSPTAGFDCSGLVYWTYGRIGIELPHSSYALYGLGRPVARSRLRPGDLLFFYGLGHVGIYVGRGRMVHAPRSGRLVEVVSLGRRGYGGSLVGARRIVRG